jgi:hypothetical protein
VYFGVEGFNFGEGFSLFMQYFHVLFFKARKNILCTCATVSSLRYDHERSIKNKNSDMILSPGMLAGVHYSYAYNVLIMDEDTGV